MEAKSTVRGGSGKEGIRSEITPVNELETKDK
jgi:hypothetical protein